MAFSGIHDTRIKPLNDRPVVQGRYVLYWMQQSQRAELNHALEYAVQEANRLGRGVVVAFGLTDDYPEANLRHYTFMLEGLKETEQALVQRGIRMVVRRGSPPEVALALGREACLIVCDCGYLRHQRQWRQAVAHLAACRVVQVESDLIVPVETASAKAQIGARTLRPRIHRQLGEYLQTVPSAPVGTPTAKLRIDGLSIADTAAVLKALRIDRSVSPVSGRFKGGASEAKRRLAEFIKNRLPRYDRNHNQPQTDDTSHLSPYLHFGQISPLYMALEIMKAPGPKAAKDAFLEEMIVRRELACNFTHYTPAYDSFGCIPGWAQTSLTEHRRDRRPYLYSAEQFENAATHDPYWNAAMREMTCTGFMHTYMRMYWGKKVLEWSRTPEEGFATTLALNNKYFIDGRDPNSYTGVAWVYGVHDRAWPQRAVFGKVRTMMASGLERKCDIQGYVKKVDAICSSSGQLY
ncbi:MAG: deoxyribodipyrimidine photo-lyase [Desulfobacterales bacterium]|jgi:deoxyribodipyrimidine photo-lyase|nr:deoxyribodipyrimidine photo-lyase [Desulfobacterales bacterium]